MSHRKYNYNNYEMVAMFLLNVPSCFVALPSIALFKKDQKIMNLFIAFFLMLTSGMYHITESFDIDEILLTELQWHRLDNIGASCALISIIILLMDNRDEFFDDILNAVALTIVIIAQEKDPWNINYTVYPILLFLGGYILVWIFRSRKPKYNKKMLAKGLLFLALGIPCFFMALDEFNDYLRVGHALWHVFVSLGAFYLSQAKKEHGKEKGYFELILRQDNLHKD